jgi:hypothetical protein
MHLPTLCLFETVGYTKALGMVISEESKSKDVNYCCIHPQKMAFTSAMERIASQIGENNGKNYVMSL